MIRIFLLLFILSTNWALADAILGLGVGITTSYEEEDDLVDFGGGLGLGAEIELVLFPRLTLDIAGSYRREDALSQYSLAGTNVADLETTATTFLLSAGPRLRVLDLTPLRLFVGAGLTFGSLALEYDKDDFRGATGSTTGLDKEEAHQFNGYYLETGAEFVLSATRALRIMGRSTNYRTGIFDTLGNENVNVSQTQFMFQFLQYVNF